MSAAPTELPSELSFSAFARLAGFKPSYITQLRHEGRLVLTEDGKAVRVPESLERIRSTRDPARQDATERHAAAREKSPPAKQPPPPPDDDGAADVDPDADTPAGPASPATSAFHQARARKEHYLALTAQRDYEISMGQLLNAADVDAAVDAAITQLRVRLEALPDRLAPELAGMTDEQQVRSLLSDTIEQALRDLARHFRQRNSAEGAA